MTLLDTVSGATLPSAGRSDAGSTALPSAASMWRQTSKTTERRSAVPDEATTFVVAPSANGDKPLPKRESRGLMPATWLYSPPLPESDPIGHRAGDR